MLNELLNEETVGFSMDWSVCFDGMGKMEVDGEEFARLLLLQGPSLVYQLHIQNVHGSRVKIQP